MIDNKRFGRFYYQKKVLGLSLKNCYDRYLFLGDTRCISTWLTALLIRLFFPSRRVYFWTHGWYGKETKREARLKKCFFRLANGGLFLYGFYAKQLMEKEGFNPKKLFVIHNSLAYQQQLQLRSSLGHGKVIRNHFHSDEHTLLFVGRLTKVKHIDLLLDAICKTNGKYNLVIIGDGVEKEELQEQSRRLSLEDRVWFYGPTYNEIELSQLISCSDLCVSPGNVGLTAMHSMVYGTPVLTHDDFSWQMPEFEAIIEGETGGFFHRNDVLSLAYAIDGWFNKKDYNREEIRSKCYSEIDYHWTPEFQMSIFKERLL